MIEWVTHWVAAGGYTAVFLLCVLENLVPPIPSEVILPLAGFVAARGEMTVWGVVLAGLAGTVAGNAVLYEAARRVETRRLRALVDRHGRWLGARGEALDRAEETLKRYGPVAIAFARVLPGLRTLISVPAGVFLIPRKVFYVWTTVGSAIWITALTFAGYALESQYHRVSGWLDSFGSVVMAVAVAALGYWLFRSWRRSRQG